MRSLFGLCVVLSTLPLIADGFHAFFRDDRGAGFKSEVAEVLEEIKQLHLTVEAYREKHGAFPASMSEADMESRHIHFMRHVHAAYPDSNYGTTSEQFCKLRDQIKTNFGPNSQGYNYLNDSGDLQPLNLDTLDQAETLVFWLGGFPTPYDPQLKVTVANRRIFGLHRDREAPLKRDSARLEGTDPMRYRTEYLFQFDETRLTDIDDDGWLEYSPLPTRSGERSAPYTYFDADGYALSVSGSGSAPRIGILGYPRHGDPHAAESAKGFGLAVPLARYFDPSFAGPMRWYEPEGFQIICAGLDGKYSEPVTGDLSRAYRVPVSPRGHVFHRSTNYAEAANYCDGELDNLNNFSTETLKSARDTFLRNSGVLPP